MSEITFLVKKSVKTLDIRLQRVCTKLQMYGTTNIVQGKSWYIHKQKHHSIKNATKISILEPSSKTIKTAMIHIIHESSSRKHDIIETSKIIYVDINNIDYLEEIIAKELCITLELSENILKFDVLQPIEEVKIPWKRLIFDRAGTFYEKKYVAEYVPNASLSSNPDEIEALIETTKQRHIIEAQMLEKRQADELAKMHLWKEALTKINSKIQN